MDDQNYTREEIEEGKTVLNIDNNVRQYNQAPANSRKPPLKWGLIIPLVFLGLIIISIGFAAFTELNIPLISDTFNVIRNQFNPNLKEEISVPEKKVKHGAYYDEIDLPDIQLGKDRRLLISYSEIRNVYEDNRWKRIEEARSLKNSGIGFGNIKTDARYGWEIVDFNSTSITFIPVLYDDVELNKNITLKVNEIPKAKFKYNSRNERRSVTFYGDVFNSNFTIGDNSTTFSVTSVNEITSYSATRTSVNRASAAGNCFGVSNDGSERRCVINNSLSQLPADANVLRVNFSFVATGFTEFGSNYTIIGKNHSLWNPSALETNSFGGFEDWVSTDTVYNGNQGINITRFPTNLFHVFGSSATRINLSFTDDGNTRVEQYAGKDFRYVFLSEGDLQAQASPSAPGQLINVGDDFTTSPILYIEYEIPSVNVAPNITAGYPQINSTDGLNSTFRNLTVVWQATDPDVNQILRYNLTVYRNNLSNLTYRNLDYTNGTLQVEIVNSGNFTNSIGVTYFAQVEVCDNSSSCLARNTSELLLINAAPTTPSLNLPIDNLMTANYTINMSANGSTDLEGDTINYEFYLEREVNPPTTLYGNTTAQSNTTSLGQDGRYYWRVRVNDAQAVSGYTSTRSFLVDRRFITENITIANNSAVYSSRQNYGLNLTFNLSTTYDVNANFIYNNIREEITKTNLSTNQRLFTITSLKEITSTSTIAWNWNLTITQNNETLRYNTSFSGATSVQDTQFALCNTSLTSPIFLNITFRDEADEARINASIEASTFNFFVDVHGSRKSHTFSNTSRNYEYDFCASPARTYLNANVSGFNYKGGTAYPQRTYTENLLLHNGTYNKTLYLLSSSDGSYTTFQVLTIANAPIENVYVTVEKQDGVFNLIESKYTDAAGGATFFVNPNTAYRFTFVKGGYKQFQTTLTPTQGTYTITLETSDAAGAQNINRGVIFDINPRNTTLLNQTNYTFSFDIQSDYWTLTEYGFVLTNGTNYTGNTIAGGSARGTTGTGSLVSTNINTGNYSQVIMNYYWVINSTYANGTRAWTVASFYQGQYSLLTFCEDLKRFSGSGFNDFSRGIIAFIFIFIVTAGVNFALAQYATISYISVAGVAFASTAFADYCGSLIPTPIGAIEHFITVLVGLIFLGLVINEFINRS